MVKKGGGNFRINRGPLNLPDFSNLRSGKTGKQENNKLNPSTIIKKENIIKTKPIHIIQKNNQQKHIPNHKKISQKVKHFHIKHPAHQNKRHVHHPAIHVKQQMHHGKVHPAHQNKHHVHHPVNHTKQQGHHIQYNVNAHHQTSQHSPLPPIHHIMKKHHDNAVHQAHPMPIASHAANLNKHHDEHKQEEQKHEEIKKVEIKDKGKIIEKYNLEVDGAKVDIEIRKNELGVIYHLILPEIKVATISLLADIRNELISVTTVSMKELTDPASFKTIKERFLVDAKKMIRERLPTIQQEVEDYLIGKLIQDMLGLGEIEFLISDSALEEIVIPSAKEPIRVYSKKYGWIETNIQMEKEEKIVNYSNIIARRVGRQITVLNPLLDAHLVTGDRINAVLYPIDTKGNTITIRKFARDPFTMIDLINTKTCDLETAAILWLAIEFEMNILISGGTASGKTSFLNACMPFIPGNQRIISIEDSVLGSSSILVRENEKFYKTTVGEVIDRKINEGGYKLNDGSEIAENDGLEIFSMSKSGKVELAKPSSLIRHKVKKPIYKIKLSTGREIGVTKDHSLFTLFNNKIAPIKSSDLEVGSFIATPRLIDYEGSGLTLDLTNYLDHFNDCILEGGPIRKILDNYNKKDAELISYYKERGIIPVSLFKESNLILAEEDKEKVRILPKRSNRNGRVGIPLIIKFDRDLAWLAGMWLADGSYDKNSVILSMVNEECDSFAKSISAKFGVNLKRHSDGVSLMLNSKVFKIFFEKCLGMKGNAYTKKLPDFVYNLNKNLVASLINGYFSGDGTVKKNEVCCSSASLELLKGIQTLLLRFGVLLRIGKLKQDKTYESSISDVKFLKLFRKNVDFLHNEKKRRLELICDKKSKESKDVIPLDKSFYLTLKHLAGERFREGKPYKYWKSWQGQYLSGSNIGRGSLQKMCQLIKGNMLNSEEITNIEELAFNDLIWDQIVSIEEFNYEGDVYDFSVPGNESFICENIVAHNTRELMLPDFLYWTPLVTRSPNPEGKGEVTMLNLLVNSLRMRPDRIILGEMRKKEEAMVLFEAMHTGHSVYATVHADSAHETISRLTNPPLDVPKNLLKAVNLNVVMFRDRRKGIRRILQIAEIEADGDEAKANIIYRWSPEEDKLLKHSESSRFFEEISRNTGMTQKEISSYLDEKKKIITWLIKKQIRDLNSFGKVLNLYYKNKELLMASINKDDVKAILGK